MWISFRYNDSHVGRQKATTLRVCCQVAAVEAGDYLSHHNYRSEIPLNAPKSTNLAPYVVNMTLGW